MNRFGISVAMLTPFLSDGGLNTDLLVTHSKNVLKHGVQGITLYGTTGEGASISQDERAMGIAAVRASGITADKITLGIFANSIGDATAQVHQGLEFGVKQFLLLPPFYFKDPSDEGLFEWHAQLFASVSKGTNFILYHIPQLSHVSYSLPLVERLSATYPDRINGIKDSSANWENAEKLLKFGQVPVLIGDERILHRAVAKGAAGSICGMSNLHPERMCKIFETATEDTALSAEVNEILKRPVIPALKTLLSKSSGTSDWEAVRPPLSAMNAKETDELLNAIKNSNTKQMSWELNS